MNNKQLSITLLLTCLILTFFSQTPSCYEMNKDEYYKLSYKNFNNDYLKPKLKWYLSCESGLPEPKFFKKYNFLLKGKSKAFLKTNDLKVEVISQKFDKDKHSFITYSDNTICKIDGKAFFGTDDNLPLEEFKNIQINIDQKEVFFPKNSYSELYNPTLSYGNEARITLLQDKKEGYTIIIMYASDGAGGYGIVWIFKNGKYLTRIVDFIC